jgi:hypothetical protein
MSTTIKNELRELMTKAWQLVKVYGFTLSEALRQMWALLKLRKAMKDGIVKFMYTKLNGEVRTAWGTLKESLIPQMCKDSDRKKNDSVMVYYDQEKASYRCFKIANFLKIA